MVNRKYKISYIGLGSNLNQPEQQILEALKSLSDIEQVEVLCVSSLYQSKPHGPQDQPDFVNAVAAIRTSLTPFELLDELQDIELKQNRIKTRHWGERTIDLDILLYEFEYIQHERLCIPHQHMLEREFVLVPLLEIAPLICLPDGSHVREYEKKSSAGLEKISQPPKIQF